MNLTDILLKAFLIASLAIAGTATLLQFFPSIRLHATYKGVMREVYLRQERGRVIMGTRAKILKRSNSNSNSMAKAKAKARKLRASQEPIAIAHRQ